MPQAIAAYAAEAIGDAILDTAITSAAADVIVAATYLTVEVGVTLGLAVSIAALTAPGTPDPEAIAFPRKQADPERVSGFGRARISGAYMLYDTASNGTSVDVFAMHDGLIDGYEIFYLNDDRVSLVTSDTFGTDNWVQALDRPDGRYSSADKIQILTRLGEATETAFSNVSASDLPNWDSTHRGDGIASLALGCGTPKLTYYDQIYPNGLPLPSAVARLQLVHDPRTARSAWTRNCALHLMAYLTTAPGGMGMSMARRITPAIDTWIDAANDCDLATPLKNLSSQLSVLATAGDTSISLYEVTGLEVGMSLLIGAGLGAEDLAVVNGIDGLVVSLSGELASDHAVDEIVSWVTDIDSPATEPRYAAGGVYKWTTAPSDVVKKILECFDGWLCPRGDGALVLRSGRYYEPTVTLTDDHIVSYNFQHYVEDENATNVFKVHYSSPVHDFNVVETDEWRDEDDIAARGLERPADLTLDWVQSNGQARRLAKRAMSRSTAPLRGTIVTNLYGMNALGERYVRLQISEVDVLNDVVIEITGKGEIDLAKLQLSYEWVLADPNIDDWSPSIEEGSAPGGVETNSLAPLTKAVITALVQDVSDVASGVGGVRLRVSIADLDRTDLTFALRWKSSSDGFWAEQQFQDVDDTAGVTLITGYVPSSATISVEVAYSAGDGRYSGWSDTSTIITG